jgi:hypothetical protein
MVVWPFERLDMAGDVRIRKADWPSRTSRTCKNCWVNCVDCIHLFGNFPTSEFLRVDSALDATSQMADSDCTRTSSLFNCSSRAVFLRALGLRTRTARAALTHNSTRFVIDCQSNTSSLVQNFRLLHVPRGCPSNPSRTFGQADSTLFLLRPRKEIQQMPLLLHPMSKSINVVAIPTAIPRTSSCQSSLYTILPPPTRDKLGRRVPQKQGKSHNLSHRILLTVGPDMH